MPEEKDLIVNVEVDILYITREVEGDKKVVAKLKKNYFNINVIK